ncbi:nuclear transport factor 2 family protein [Candidatus Wolfebacteria bacterium]|nr:nuclear transport factor 2 family protein [Candidatus Wolfebacteria bacterium]
MNTHKTREDKNITIVLEILKDQAEGNVENALQKMTPDYLMTWVEKRGEELFPHTGTDFADEMRKLYRTYDYRFDVKNITGADDAVMVELIETVADKKTGKTWCTPLVLVFEMEDGRVKTGRHYLDPTLSRQELLLEEIEKAFPRTSTKMIIG